MLVFVKTNLFFTLHIFDQISQQNVPKLKLCTFNLVAKRKLLTKFQQILPSGLIFPFFTSKFPNILINLLVKKGKIKPLGRIC